jgi:predicted outer membrane repeat protein
MRPTAATAVAALLAVVLTVSAVTATTITVAADGSGMFTQIQVGLDAASSGDTVSVAAGDYEGPENRDLDFGGKAITLTAPAGWISTGIFCGTLGRGFFFHGGEDTTAVVQGFSVLEAVADSGAGAFCRNGSSPRFIDCAFELNSATESGGAICCVASSPVIRDCRFIDNEVGGGGSYAYGGALACFSGSAPLVADSDFITNLGQNGGGAVYCHSSPAAFARCQFSSNQLGTYGNSGACMMLSDADGATMTGCVFRGNGTQTAGVGGGIYAGSTDVTIADCQFIANSAGAGAGIHFASASSGTVTGCTFAENESDWTSAAGVSCFQNSNLLISGCTFVHNRDYHLVFQDSSPTVEYSILAFNTPLGAMACIGTATPEIHHCFVYGNVGAHGDTLCGGNDHDIEYQDPLICGFMSEYYWICEDSPCRPGVTWPSLVGAWGVGCDPCGSPVEPATWGTVKALFR